MWSRKEEQETPTSHPNSDYDKENSQNQGYIRDGTRWARAGTGASLGRVGSGGQTEERRKWNGVGAMGTQAAGSREVARTENDRRPSDRTRVPGLFAEEAGEMKRSFRVLKPVWKQGFWVVRPNPFEITCPMEEPVMDL
ncbi:unnamed protein product [Calypogeia fissa]